MTSKRDAALSLAKQGFRVFPLAINGKTPAHARVDWTKTATTDPIRIAEMWTDPVFDSEIDYNIGIALDADTFVFDEDVSNGKQGDKSREILEAVNDTLPPTFTVRSARGGRHRYLRTAIPVGNSASRVGKHIDIKSEGGFAVGPGSVIDGAPYEVETAAPIADAPDWLIAAAGTPQRRAATSSAPLADIDTTDAIKRATEYLATHAPDSGTFAVAAKVKDFGISEPQCLDLMMEHWPPAEAKGTDHVEFRVANAYRYGQNAVGINSPEAEFEAVEIDAKQPPKRKGLYFTPFDAAKPDFNETYLIDDIMGLGTMVVTYGDSNSGKSFVSIDQGYHIAAGVPWNGHKVTQGLVVYVAAEGGRGFHKRLEALRRHHKVASIPFALVPCPIDLQSDAADTNKLIKVIRDAEAHYGQKCVRVDIDTLARAMGGGDENTASDMGKLVTHCDRLREATGATVNIVHHTGKDKSKGARGSSALRAATDTEIEIEPGFLHIQKQRDLEAAKSLAFSLQVVEIGHRPDGKVVTSCVVAWSAVNEFDAQVSPLAQQMFEVLERLQAAKRDEIDEDETLSGDEKAARLRAVNTPWIEWQMSCLSCLIGPRGKPLSRSNLFPLRLELSNSGLVKKNKSNQWIIS